MYNMKIKFIARDGFPVERIMRRPITNLIRLIIHTKEIIITLKSENFVVMSNIKY